MSRPSYRQIARILLAILAIAAVCWSFVLGRSVAISEQIAVYQVLQNVSGIMFAVFGLWIGLLYPGLRKRVFERSRADCIRSDERDDDNQVADHLLLPFFLSLAILLLTLVAVVAHPLLRQSTTLVAHKELLRGSSFAVLSGLALAQLWTIFSAMHMTEALKGVVSRQSTRNKVANRIRQNTKEGTSDGQ
ncbi:hypothetical protein Pla111_30830 [Botrimarina hoheduenensis]|uniref:Uncharacterized protein n=1 Tax=Botrimarina hoheduenensis TaxID=2528000 RepID=A0A5C5VUP9_9BACT|nr:hypothetical protein Pla111_30830 [Botrimarina hoheduenensis]